MCFFFVFCFVFFRKHLGKVNAIKGSDFTETVCYAVEPTDKSMEESHKTLALNKMRPSCCFIKITNKAEFTPKVYTLIYLLAQVLIL